MSAARATAMNLPYKEGTWFAVPLRQGGYAIGIVARHVPKVGEVILAYFFGPRRDTIPTLAQLVELSPDAAIRILRVGDLGIIDGSWPIIGDSPEWEREKWPIPAFVRRDEVGKMAWRVEYADDDPSQVVSERPVAFDCCEYDRNSLFGAGAAEAVLTQTLIA